MQSISRKALQTTFALSLLAASLSTMAADSEASRWNLKDIYASQSDWDKDAARLKHSLQGAAAYARFTKLSPCKPSEAVSH